MMKLFLTVLFVMMPHPQLEKIEGFEGFEGPLRASDAGYSQSLGRAGAPEGFCIRDGATGSRILIDVFDGSYLVSFGGGHRQGRVVFELDEKRRLLNVQDGNVLLGHIDLDDNKAAIAISSYCGGSEIIATDHYTIGECP